MHNWGHVIMRQAEANLFFALIRCYNISLEESYVCEGVLDLLPF